jgi:hypothetical protein
MEEVVAEFGPPLKKAPYWLTDYVISTSLAEAYELNSQAAAPAALSNGADVLTLQVKSQIDAEVQRQLTLESSEAQGAVRDPAMNGIGRILSRTVCRTCSWPVRTLFCN